ncbi:MAG: hypothetical protein ACREXJ_05760 [Gammaproteobacteria bacterium]
MRPDPRAALLLRRSVARNETAVIAIAIAAVLIGAGLRLDPAREQQDEHHEQHHAQ